MKPAKRPKVRDPIPHLGEGTETARQVIRQMIQHEDDLRDQRFGYLLTLNGLLFAALGFAWNYGNAKGLVVAFAIFGVVVAGSAWVSMSTSNSAIDRLQRYEGELVGALPVMGITSAELPGCVSFWQPWRVVPPALGIVWPLLMVIRLA